MDITIESEGKETSATQAAYRTMRRMILTGELAAGEKLKIEQLRRMLDVGASPIREALSLLTSDMLVERLDQRGFRAAPVGKENFEEILMLRCTLEDMALRASISRANTDWEDQLVLIHHHMKKSSERGAANFEDTHKAFHMALLNNSGLPMLEKYCSQLYDLNIRYRFLAAVGPTYEKRNIADEHQCILEATLDHDAETATKLLIDHYRRTGDYLGSQMDA